MIQLFGSVPFLLIKKAEGGELMRMLTKSAVNSPMGDTCTSNALPVPLLGTRSFP